MQVGPGLFGIQGDGSRKTHHEIPPPCHATRGLGLSDSFKFWEIPLAVQPGRCLHLHWGLYLIVLTLGYRPASFGPLCLPIEKRPQGARDH